MEPAPLVRASVDDDSAFFRDDVDPVLILQPCDGGQWIAVHDHHIGQLTYLQCADFAFRRRSISGRYG